MLNQRDIDCKLARSFHELFGAIQRIDDEERRCGLAMTVRLFFRHKCNIRKCGTKTGRDQRIAELFGDVVVVTLECPSRCADPLGKGMELVEGVVAHEMAPQASAPVPVRFIEEESHSPRLALAAHPAQGSEVCPDGDIDPEQQREDEHDACGDGRIDERADVGV